MGVRYVDPGQHRLLLVGGVGRSGTTFVQTTLARSMAIGGIEDFESKLFSEAGSLLDLRDFYVDTYSFSRFEWLADVFISNVRINFAALSADGFPEQEPAGAAVAAARDLIAALYRDRLGCTDLAGTFRRHAMEFIARTINIGDTEWILEKTPHNALQLQRVVKLFPNTRMILVVRDPVSTARSLIRQDWYQGSFEDAVVWIRLFYEQLWNTMAKPDFPSQSCLTIRIEDCAQYPDDVARQVEEYLEIPAGTIDFARVPAPPPARDKALSQGQAAFAAAQLSNIVQRYGYHRA